MLAYIHHPKPPVAYKKLKGALGASRTLFQSHQFLKGSFTFLKEYKASTGRGNARRHTPLVRRYS